MFDIKFLPKGVNTVVVFTSDQICKSVTSDGAEIGMVAGQTCGRWQAVGSRINWIEYYIKIIIR